MTSEVRIKDNLYPDDGDIYFQLAGGVTSSHIFMDLQIPLADKHN